MDRYLRNAEVVNQEKINNREAVIAGVGAVGSSLAVCLAKMGMKKIYIYDHDVVDEVNLSTQGFYHDEIGTLKVEAIRSRVLSINPKIAVEAFSKKFTGKELHPQAVFFACVDSMQARRFVYRSAVRSKGILLDGRMAAETMTILVAQNGADLEEYKKTLYPDSEVAPERCTAKATIYCASVTASLLCALYKQVAMDACLVKHVWANFPLMAFTATNKYPEFA